MDESRWRIEEVKFVEIEIDTALTFAQLAFTEFWRGPDKQRLDELVKYAMLAYSNAKHFLPSVKDTQEQVRLKEKLNRATEVIGELERRVRPAERDNNSGER